MSALNSVPDGAGGTSPAAAAAGGAMAAARANGQVLSARGLSKRYGRRKGVDKLHLELRRGGIVALLGPTGAGVTARLYMSGGFRGPNAATTRLGGQDS